MDERDTRSPRAVLGRKRGDGGSFTLGRCLGSCNARRLEFARVETVEAEGGREEKANEVHVEAIERCVCCGFDSDCK